MVGQQIKNLRQTLGQTQTEFATKLGIDQSSLSYIENGHIMPSLQLLMAIHKTFAVTYEWLLEGESIAAVSDGKKMKAEDVPEWVAVLARNIDTIMFEEKLDDFGFGVRCAITAGRVRDIRQGKTTPTAGELMQILAAFDIYNANWLLRDKGAMKPDTSQQRMDEILYYNREMMKLMQATLAKKDKNTPRKSS